MSEGDSSDKGRGMPVAILEGDVADEFLEMRRGCTYSQRDGSDWELELGENRDWVRSDSTRLDFDSTHRFFRFHVASRYNGYRNRTDDLAKHWPLVICVP